MLNRVMLVIGMMALVVSATSAQAMILCTLLVDAETGNTLLEEGDCTSRVTPASTFKVPLAVIGYDTGLLADAHSPIYAHRKGDPDWGGKNWTRDTDPASWMRYSVVWYSQRLTLMLGAQTLARYVELLGFGNADFRGDTGQNNGLERAWLSSSLQISPREQVVFLQGLVNGTLPVSDQAMELTRSLLQSKCVAGWQISGKTGGAYPRNADRSFDYARGLGWFVGWATKGDRTVVFARLTQAEERLSGSPGILARQKFLNKWPELVAKTQTAE